MRIKIAIGTRGTRKEFEDTYTRELLADKGLILLDKDLYGPCSPCAVHVKYGWIGSFSDNDVLTYMGHEIWDLKVYKSNKDKEV